METVIIDDREFEFECSVFPVVADEAITLTKSSIKTLIIEESIDHGWMVGDITIDNSQGIISSIISPTTPGSTVMRLFIRDVTPNDICTPNIENPNGWRIEGLFEITADSGGVPDPYIRFKIVDYTYSAIKKINTREILKEELGALIGGESGAGIPGMAGNRYPSKNVLSDLNGRTGEILKKIFEYRLEYEEGNAGNPYSAAKKGGKIMTPWDNGKYTFSQKTIEGDEKIFDTIKRVHNYHVPYFEGDSHVYDTSIFEVDRNGDIRLTPLSTILKNANESPKSYVLELAFIGGRIGDSNKEPSPDLKVKTDGNSLGDLSIITQSKFNTQSLKYVNEIRRAMAQMTLSVNMGGVTQEEIIPKFIDSIKDYYKEKFVDIYEGNCKSSVAFPEVEGYSEQKIVNEYPDVSNPQTIKDLYGGKIIKHLVLNGFTCEVKMRGSLHRTYGKIVEIGTFDPTPKNDDRKKLGKWFVKSVKHEFIDDKYSNTLLCCKPYVTNK